MTRSTTAGSSAGSTVRQAIEAALASRTSSEADEHLEHLRELFERAELRVEELGSQHAEQLLEADDDTLAGLEAAQAGAKRDAMRLSVAITAVTNRRAELEQAERVAAAEKSRAAAAKAQQRGLDLYRLFDEHAAALAAVLAELEEVHDAIAVANRAVAGTDLERVALPNEALSRAPVVETETRRIDVTPQGPRIMDGAGREVGSGGGQHFGGSRRQPVYREERVEVVVDPGRQVPDLLRATINLPRADADRREPAWIGRG